ncbi:multidrug resistance protein [Penicillium herquei]|nr:multidrug resistance protein [Penicillium herquei]
MVGNHDECHARHSRPNGLFDVNGPSGTAPVEDFQVDWESSDADTLNPRCFRKTTKWLIVLIVSHVSLCITCSSSIYTTTYDKMEADFHNSRIVSTLGLSSFVLGLAMGPMLLSPLSEFYGRKPIYVLSWSLHIVFIIPQAVAQHISVVVLFRFFDGFSGSAFLAVSGGTVGDLFSHDELQAPMALFSMSPFIGPSLGPLLGGFINYYTNWRWTYYVLIIWSLVVWLTILLLVPETHDPTLLEKKAAKLRKDTGDNRWAARSAKPQTSITTAVGRSLLRPFQLLLFEPMCLILCIYSAILLGIIYNFFGAIPLIFRTNHGFNLWQTGLAFMGIMASSFLCAATDPIWHRVRAALIRRHTKGTGMEGSSEPEFRLPPAILGSFLAPIGLFMFGWTTYSSMHWMVSIMGSAIFGTGNMLIFTGIFTFLVDAYPLYAASALAANALVRNLFAAAFPLFGNQMYEKLGYQWAASVLAFLTVAMLPFPYLFFKYGKLLRGKSQFAIY